MLNHRRSETYLGETGAKWTGFLLFGRIFLTATRDKKIFAQRDPPLSLLFFSIKTPPVRQKTGVYH